MAVPIEQVIAAFDAFITTGDEYVDQDRLRTIIAQWGEHPVSRQAIAVRSMLGVFERHPRSLELGTPGPLVHAIEAYGQDLGGPAYKVLLADSIRRVPAAYTLWMVNRTINADPDHDLLQLLRDVATSPSVNGNLRAYAADFVEHQTGDR